jgi:hypothetical protein
MGREDDESKIRSTNAGSFSASTVSTLDRQWGKAKQE